MASNTSMASMDFEVFFVEHLWIEPSPQVNNSPNVLNSAELSAAYTREMRTISSVASPEPNIATLDDDSSNPTFPYGFGAQQSIFPRSPNDLNLLPNPFIIPAAMTVVQQNPTQRDDNYSPQSPEPSEQSPISTSPMSVSTFDFWDTPHTTTGDNTFYSEDEPRRVPWTSPLD